MMSSCIHGYPDDFTFPVMKKVLHRTGCPSCMAERITELEQENAMLREVAAEWKSRHEAVCISLRDSDHNNKDAMREAVSLATWLYDRYFLTDDSEFVLCDTTAGVISQIDNMVAGLLADAGRLRGEEE